MSYNSDYKEKIKKMMEEDYEEFFKALISEDIGVDNEDILDYVYKKFKESDYCTSLLNDDICDFIDEAEDELN